MRLEFLILGDLQQTINIRPFTRFDSFYAATPNVQIREEIRYFMNRICDVDYMGLAANSFQYDSRYKQAAGIIIPYRTNERTIHQQLLDADISQKHIFALYEQAPMRTKLKRRFASFQSNTVEFDKESPTELYMLFAKPLHSWLRKIKKEYHNKQS